MTLQRYGKRTLEDGTMLPEHKNQELRSFTTQGWITAAWAKSCPVLLSETQVRGSQRQRSAYALVEEI